MKPAKFSCVENLSNSTKTSDTNNENFVDENNVNKMCESTKRNNGKNLQDEIHLKSDESEKQEMKNEPSKGKKKNKNRKNSKKTKINETSGDTKDKKLTSKQ